MTLPWHIVRLWLLLSLATLLAGLLLAPGTAAVTSLPVDIGPHPLTPSFGSLGEGEWLAVRQRTDDVAGDDLNQAGLVVRDAEGRITYAWVPFAEEEISGIELLKRSGIPVVTVGFGALGEGVCSIGGQGCGVAECRRTVCQGSSASAPFWQYFRQNPDNPAEWTWLVLGASATDVRDGDVFGWSWTADEPGLPPLPAPEIAALAGATDSESSQPAVRTILPEGIAAATTAPPPDGRTTVAAVAILAVIGLAAIGLSGWSGRSTATWRFLAGGRRPRHPYTTPSPLPPSAPRLLPPASRPLDPRAWLIWAVAASLPPLLGRNPWLLLDTLIAVLGVWAAWGSGTAGARWRPLLRLALFFGAVSVLFNLLTAHVGDRVIMTLPETWPIVGGPLTVNAAIYGVLSAMAILSLVAVSATLGATLDWSTAIRLLPRRMAPLAVAGSVAWSYLPRTTVALTEIREAQMARGYRPRGIRDAGPLVMPLLAGGLERAMMTAEALEARAFGAPLSPDEAARPWQVAALLAGFVAALTGAFCLALGQIAAAGLLVATSALLLVVGLFVPHGAVSSPRRTRYRDPVWERPEWIVAGTAAGVLVIALSVLFLDPAAFRYEPYPTLTAPAINLPLLAALGFLLTPAAVRR
jgi:energy-coupling factor transport system permease protein